MLALINKIYISFKKLLPKVLKFLNPFSSKKIRITMESTKEKYIHHVGARELTQEEKKKFEFIYSQEHKKISSKTSNSQKK